MKSIEMKIIKRAYEMDKNLRQMLDVKNISLKDLSAQVGIPASTIHGWLNGVPPKNVHEIKKIADFFGVTIDILCFGERETKSDRQEKVIAEFESVELVLRVKTKEIL